MLKTLLFLMVTPIMITSVKNNKYNINSECIQIMLLILPIYISLLNKLII